MIPPSPPALWLWKHWTHHIIGDHTMNRATTITVYVSDIIQSGIGTDEFTDSKRVYVCLYNVNSKHTNKTLVHVRRVFFKHWTFYKQHFTTCTSRTSMKVSLVTAKMGKSPKSLNDRLVPCREQWQSVRIVWLIVILFHALIANGFAFPSNTSNI